MTMMAAGTCMQHADAQMLHYVWALGATGAVNNDRANSIQTDASGNMYIMGSYSSPLLTFGSNVMTNAGLITSDMFLLKLNAAGTVQWAKSAGGGLSDEPRAMAADASGSVYAVGDFSSATMNFSGNILTNSSILSEDMFIVKYDASGNVVWAKNGSGTGSEHAYAVATDASGNVYVAGDFSGSTLSFGSTTLTNIGGSGSDIFVAKFDASGSLVWAYNFGGGNNDRAFALTADASGNIYMAGSYSSSTINFGATTLTNGGSGADMYVVRLNATGTATWAYSTSGSGWDEAKTLAVDASGNVYVGGTFNSSSLVFGATTLTNASAGSNDMFLVKFNSTGSVVWASGMGGNGSDVVSSMALDAAGRIYLAGRYASSMLSLGSYTLTKTGDSTMFLAEVDASTGAAVWGNTTGGTGSSDAAYVSTDNSGEVYTAGSYNDGSMTFGSMVLNNASTGSDDMYATRLNRTTGINEPLAATHDVVIYPVPNNGDMNVQFVGKGYTRLNIFDATGRMVYEQPLNENDLDRKVRIQVSNVADGVCIVQAHSTTGTTTKRIMILR